MSIIRMQIQAVSTTVNTVGVDIPADGTIEAITMGQHMEDASPVTGEGARCQLSFLGEMVQVNDSRGVLCDTAERTFFADAARIALSGHGFCVVTPISIPVNGGERLFLHAVCDSASLIVDAVAFIFIRDKVDARPRIRRR